MTLDDSLFMGRDGTLRDAMRCIDANRTGIALVADGERRLLGTVTDGDIRRAILADIDLDTPLPGVLAARAEPAATAPAGTGPAELLKLMADWEVRHLPLLDEAGRVVDVALLTDLVRDYELPIAAMVMAGGFGSRLLPLTQSTPKPMLPVGDRPVLEHIIDQLRVSGIRQVSVATHFRPEVISSHFGDGSRFGVEISYVHEDEPLGTAGALGLLDDGEEPLLVMNGDILTRINLQAMIEFHRDHRADMTVAVKREEIELPYGVVALAGEQVTDIEEKPVIRHFSSAGVYLVGQKARRLVEPGRPLDMPDLIREVVRSGGTVVGFPLREYWIDIGRIEEYDRARDDHNEGIPVGDA